MTYACHDCGLSIMDPRWVWGWVPTPVWNLIRPVQEGRGGYLCVGCMAARCEDRGLQKVPLWLHSHVFRAEAGSVPLEYSGE